MDNGDMSKILRTWTRNALKESGRVAIHRDARQYKWCPQGPVVLQRDRRNLKVLEGNRN